MAKRTENSTPYISQLKISNNKKEAYLPPHSKATSSDSATTSPSPSFSPPSCPSSNNWKPYTVNVLKFQTFSLSVFKQNVGFQGWFCLILSDLILYVPSTIFQL